MLTGDWPFKTDAKSHFIDKIRNRHLNIPKKIAKKYPDAADLIDKLLQVDPRNRLGSGPEDSFTNYQALKSHAFFKDIDFETINNTNIVISKSLLQDNVEQYDDNDM